MRTVTVKQKLPASASVQASQGEVIELPDEEARSLEKKGYVNIHREAGKDMKTFRRGLHKK